MDKHTNPPIDYPAKAKQVLQTELTRQGVNLKQLWEKLTATGDAESYKGLSVKIQRGTFQFAFFLKCMDVLNVGEVKLNRKTPRLPQGASDARKRFFETHVWLMEVQDLLRSRGYLFMVEGTSPAADELDATWAVALKEAQEAASVFWPGGVAIVGPRPAPYTDINKIVFKDDLCTVEGNTQCGAETILKNCSFFVGLKGDE